MSRLTDGIVPPAGDATLAAVGDTTREPQLPSAGPDTVPVYLVNGTRTSQGPGPGLKYLPSPEANALVRAKLAVAGTTRPGGMRTAASPRHPRRRCARSPRGRTRSPRGPGCGARRLT
jgi:hypothetical protein